MDHEGLSLPFACESLRTRCVFALYQHVPQRCGTSPFSQLQDTLSALARAAAAYSQWPYGLDWNSSHPCMGYSLRVMNWTLVQWGTAPCTAPGTYVGPSPNGLDSNESMAWAPAANNPDPCRKNAELYRVPHDFGIRPAIEPEETNVAALYPTVFESLRHTLAKEMQIDPERLAWSLH